MTSESKTVGLLDTSVQIDKMKSKHWEDHVNEKTQFLDWTISTGISLMEFKAVVIQECIGIYNNLCRLKKFTLVRDSLIESKHRQSSLRAHLFNNLLNVFGSSFELSDVQDLRLGEKCRLKLKMDIPYLYKRFREESASCFSNPIRCNRADEPPILKRIAFETNLPKCNRGRNKTCCVESFVKQNAGPILISLAKIPFESDQLLKSMELVKSTLEHPDPNLSIDDCRKMGDFLILLERGAATHVVSTNKRDWEPLAKSVGIELIHVDHQGAVRASV